MIMWEALLGLVLVGGALMAACWAFYRAGHAAGYQANDDDRRDRREALRAEQRARAARAGFTVHQPASFPGDELWETKATTGELRELSALAETGDMDGVRGEVAAFFRLLSLHEWTRKKESAA